MIDVYFHDAYQPEDRAIRKFLWENYFHDATLLRIDYAQPSPRDVTLVVRNQEDTWRLRFHCVQHFDIAVQSFLDFALSSCIFDACFLNTPLLRRCQKNAGKPLLHLRLQLSTGLMDIVFSRFTIRRDGGRVSYSRRADSDEAYDFAASMKRLIDVLAEEPPEERRPDDMLACKLFRAQQSGDEASIRRFARELLSDTDSFNWADYAAYMLGYHGDESDLPALTAICADPECTILLRREILDAMERIADRKEEARHD